MSKPTHASEPFRFDIRWTPSGNEIVGNPNGKYIEAQESETNRLDLLLKIIEDSTDAHDLWQKILSTRKGLDAALSKRPTPATASEQEAGYRLAKLLRDEYWAQTPLDVAKLADEVLSNPFQIRDAHNQSRDNERIAFERLSKALTDGNASTWEQIFHAAEAHKIKAEDTPA